MNKFNHIPSLVVFAVLAAATCVIVLLVRSCRSGTEVSASLSAVKVEPGGYFTYSDSTRSARTWLWEFGDGCSSDKPSGTYAYQKPGDYRIRLTVDDEYEKLFTVHVRAAENTSLSRLAEIAAPATAMQGEYIVFSGVGDDKEWRWEFGASGIVDSREKNPIYAYAEPGKYQVRLRTENTQYPVVHNIEILPGYSPSDSTDVMNVIAQEIRRHLQAICDGGPFNSNYNRIVKKYLCSDEKTEVSINNTKFNDIYSYCQGLAAVGRGRKLTIEHVAVEIPDPESGCVTRVIVIQTEKEKMK